MPQIEIPFAPGQRVRTNGPYIEFDVAEMKFDLGQWLYFGNGRWFAASELTLVEPVIEWERNEDDTGWNGYVNRVWRWAASDDGRLWPVGAGKLINFIGIFPDPRSVAEDTQRMWNERKK